MLLERPDPVVRPSPRPRSRRGARACRSPSPRTRTRRRRAAARPAGRAARAWPRARNPGPCPGSRTAPGQASSPGSIAVDHPARIGHEVAAVADHDRVAVQHLAELPVQPHRMQRRAVVLEAPPARPRGARSRPPAAPRSRPRSPAPCRPPPRAGRSASPQAPRSTPPPPLADAGARARPRRSPRSPSHPRTPAETRAGSPSARPPPAPRPRPSAPVDRAREKNSSWSAGMQPRAKPFRNTGIRKRLRQLFQRVLAVSPVQVRPRHDHRALGALQQLGRAFDLRALRAFARPCGRSVQRIAAARRPP